MTKRNSAPNLLAAPPLMPWGDGSLVDPSVVWSAANDWNGLRLTSLRETDGEIAVPNLDRDMLALTTKGFKRHFSAFASLNCDSPAGASEVAAIPRGTGLVSRWQNRDVVQTFHVIEFDTSFFETYAPEIANDALLHGHLVPHGFSQRPSVAHLIGLLALEHDVEARRGRLFADTVVRLLALEIASNCWTVPSSTPAGVPVGDKRFRRAMEFIEAHFTEDLSIQQIATAACVSPSQLTALFHKILGKSPYSFVISQRLRRASDLLANTDLPIAEVALEAGFCDQAHLTRLFRARLGKTPGAVRRG